jgi:hypothetical protein
MKDIRGMTADTEAYRSEIKQLLETDSKARQIYIEMKAELATARQLRELHKSSGMVEKTAAKRTYRPCDLTLDRIAQYLKKV